MLQITEADGRKSLVVLGLLVEAGGEEPPHPFCRVLSLFGGGPNVLEQFLSLVL